MDENDEEKLKESYEAWEQLGKIENDLKTHPRIAWMKEFVDQAKAEDPFLNGYPDDITDYQKKRQREDEPLLASLY